METNVNYTMVGAFVIALIAALIVIIVWLSSGLSAQSYEIYKVYMNEAVSGLSPGGAVEFNGVNVGTVSSIKICKKDPNLVILLLKIKADTPVTNGTHAKLDIRSLSGSSYIQLEDKGTDLRPLKPLPGQTYPIIPTAPSILVRLNTTLNQISSSFSQISNSISQLLDNENLASIKASLINLRQFTDVLTKASQTFKVETLPAANRAFTNFGNLSQDVTGLSSELKQNPAVIIRGRAALPLGPGEE